MPLGTGNDVARALGWGPGYSNESLSDILQRTEEAGEVALDRWKVTRDCFEMYLMLSRSKLHHLMAQSRLIMSLIIFFQLVPRHRCFQPLTCEVRIFGYSC